MKDISTTVQSGNATHDSNIESFNTIMISIGVNCLISALILVNNSLILITFVKTKKLRTLPNGYIASLAVADLLVGVALVARNLWLYPNTRWIFNENEFVCMLYTCILFISESESIFSLVLVSLDRYTYIVHPFWYERNVSKRVVGVLILVSWLYSVPMGSLPLWINNFAAKKQCEPLQIITPTYFLTLESYFAASGVGIAFMYGRILCVRNQKRRQSLAWMIHEKKLKDSTRWPIIRFLILVCAMFFICWSPLAVMYLVYLHMQIPGLVITVTVTAAALNSGFNFFALITMNKDFRTALSNMICRRNNKYKAKGTKKSSNKIQRKDVTHVETGIVLLSSANVRLNEEQNTLQRDSAIFTIGTG